MRNVGKVRQFSVSQSFSKKKHFSFVVFFVSLPTDLANTISWISMENQTSFNDLIK